MSNPNQHGISGQPSQPAYVTTSSGTSFQIPQGSTAAQFPGYSYSGVPVDSERAWLDAEINSVRRLARM